MSKYEPSPAARVLDGRQILMAHARHARASTARSIMPLATQKSQSTARESGCQVGQLPSRLF